MSFVMPGHDESGWGYGISARLGDAAQSQIEPPALWKQVRTAGQDAVDAVISEAVRVAEHEDVSGA